MTTVITLPQTAIPLGPGAIGSGLIASSASQLSATLVQVGWPLAGGVAITYTLDYSNDSGATWRQISNGDISDKLGTLLFGCDLPSVGSSTRKVRLSYVFVKALTVSGTVQVT